MGHTALQTVGSCFAAGCSSLTTVVLPDTVTEVGRGFLDECGRVEVRSGSTAVQDAAAEYTRKLNSEAGDHGIAESVNE